MVHGLIGLLLIVVLGVAAEAINAVPWPTALLGLGGTMTGFLDFLKLKKSKLDEKVSGSFRDLVREPDYQGRLGFLHLVESDIRDVLDLVASPESPLVIFIDDLDRCAPSKTAQVVEAINLFLSGDYPNCVFVLGLEPRMVAAAMEVANEDLITKSNDLSVVIDETSVGWRFMEKVIQLPIVVPSATESGTKQYLDSLIGSSSEGSAEENIPHRPKRQDVDRFTAEFTSAATIGDVDKITDRLLESAGDQDTTAIVEASKRSYLQKYQQRDPVVREFLSSALLEFHANPRQAKRYLNLFRFLATLRQSIGLDLKAAGQVRPMPPDAALTKFVIMNIEWPQAVECLGKTVEESKDGKRTNVRLLVKLETIAKSVGSLNDDEADCEWVKQLKPLGLNLGAWGMSRRFRQFLATGDSLGAWEGSGLW